MPGLKAIVEVTGWFAGKMIKSAADGCSAPSYWKITSGKGSDRNVIKAIRERSCLETPMWRGGLGQGGCASVVPGAVGSAAAPARAARALERGHGTEHLPRPRQHRH